MLANSHIVRLLVGQHDLQELGTVSILLKPPCIPRVLAIVKVRKHGDLECAVRAERDPGLRWIRVQVIRECRF